jgi:hypothetical protein
MNTICALEFKAPAVSGDHSSKRHVPLKRFMLFTKDFRRQENQKLGEEPVTLTFLQMFKSEKLAGLVN